MATVFKRTGQGRNYWIEYTDHTGKRRLLSSGTTRKKEAQSIAQALVEQERKYALGVEAPDTNERQEQAKVAFMHHANEYLGDCNALAQSKLYVEIKTAHLEAIAEECHLRLLSDLTREKLWRNLMQLRMAGKSARTCNLRRQIVIAFYNWAVKDGRLLAHDLGHVKKMNEDIDRRRVRRALTDDELERLFEVVRGKGNRRLFYMTAAFTGLRRSELASLMWDDVDLDEGMVRVFNRKAAKVNLVPLPEQAVRELHLARLESAVGAVFKTIPGHKTRRKDFERAGIGPDELGRVADLHAMRTTLATRLAQRGVPPQIAQKVLRHADYRTTFKHYTQLGLDDVRDALEEVTAPRCPRKLLQGPGSERRGSG